MSIVVFDPDSTADVDFKDRMRHPAAADPAGGMWLSDTEPPFVDADALRKGRLGKLRAWMQGAGYGGVVLFDPYNPRSLAFQASKIGKHVPQLPGAESLDVLPELVRLERACRGVDSTQSDLFGGRPRIDSLLRDCERIATRLSDALTSRYFSHAYELPHVTRGR